MPRSNSPLRLDVLYLLTIFLFVSAAASAQNALPYRDPKLPVEQRGRQEQARLNLGELERRAATEYVSPLFRAWASSELGDPEQTRSLLEQAFAERASLLVLQGVPCFRQLRAEPLMEDLRQRLLGKEREGKSS